MVLTIKEELLRIEEAEDVRILFAVESGSRAWGFASPDSDYDVRFVYARRPEWYLRLENTRDVIEWKLDDVLDITGWDIQKALVLMRESNPSIMEWLSSPIVYRQLADTSLIDLAHRSFNPIKSCHHYLSMAERNTREHLESDSVKLKKYLYVIRAILAARHVLAKGTQPPMLFEKLVEECLEADMAPQVERLVEEKRASDETLYVPRRMPLDSWIHESIDDIEEEVKHLPHADKVPWEDYDALFCKLIGYGQHEPTHC